VASNLPDEEKIVERAYFHVSNGGMTLSIVEMKPAEGGTPEYRFKHELSLFGAKAESSFPLGSSDIVSWMNMALQRVSMKVAAAFHDRSFQPFDNKPDITHVNGVEVSKLASLVRVVARYQHRQAKEFSSPEALHEYLHEHPGADKSLHTVKKHEDHKPAPEKSETKHEHEPAHEKAGPKKSWGERFKSLGDKAKKFVTDAPKAVKSFIEDEAVRKKALDGALKHIKDAPKNVVKRVVEAAKEEVHEFKEAGHALHKLVKGEKPSKEEHAAMRKVAMHMAIGVTAAALSAGGAPLAAAGVFGKSLIKKIALKAVTRSLEHAHTLGEVGEIGHGLVELMDKFAAEGGDDMDKFGQLVAAAVAKELESFDSNSLAEALEDATG
jgi:hypothetical protein